MSTTLTLGATSERVAGGTDQAGVAAHKAAAAVLDRGNIFDRMAREIAPILCHFVLSIVEQAGGFDRVWFMARDGYLPMRIYELLATTASPPCGYLQVSRKSVMSASSPSYGFREAYLAQWNGGNQALGTLLTPLGKEPDEVLGISRQYGFVSLDESVDYRADPRFHRLIRDPRVTTIMEARHRKAKRSLHDYLAKSGFISDRNVAVVDVGWAGQIQEALELSLAEVDSKPVITGLYLALRELGGMRRAAGADMRGLVFDCATPSWRPEAVLSAVDVFEDSCRAHHGTVVAYKDGVPVHATDTPSRKVELEDEPKLASLHASILKYAAAWTTFVRARGIVSDQTRDVAESAVVSLVRFPSAEVYDFFGTIGHSLDFGTDVALPRERRASLINPISLIRGLRRARWKEGYATGFAFRVPLQAAMTAARLVRGGRHGPASCFTDIGKRMGTFELLAVKAIHYLAGRR